jgi:hypothetical protein
MPSNNHNPARGTEYIHAPDHLSINNYKASNPKWRTYKQEGGSPKLITILLYNSTHAHLASFSHVDCNLLGINWEYPAYIERGLLPASWVDH